MYKFRLLFSCFLLTNGHVCLASDINDMDPDLQKAIAQSLGQQDADEQIELAKALSLVSLQENNPQSAQEIQADEDFKLALALSLSSQEQPKVQKVDEDEELKIAMALSLEEEKKKKQALRDELMAKAIQAQEEEKIKQNEDQLASDQALAFLLQNEPHQNLKFSQAAIQELIRKQQENRKLVPQKLMESLIQAKSTYNTLVQATQKGQALLDVHDFNKQFVIPNKQPILDINNALKLNQALTAQQVIDSMRSWKLTQGFPQFENAVATLLGHLTKAPLDAETGLNVPIMLSTCLSLCQQLEDTKYHLGENTPAMTSKQYFMYIINENIAEKGGCFPGFAGRLFAANIRFLCSLLGVE